MPLTSRFLTGDDWQALRTIRLQALADSPDSFRVSLEQAEQDPEEVWRGLADGAGPTLLLLDDDGRAVAMGGALAYPQSRTAWLWGIWTVPQARGLGLSRRVVGELVEWCHAHDLEVRLHVTEGNASARAVYEALGFTDTGELVPLREGSTVRMETMRLPAAS